MPVRPPRRSRRSLLLAALALAVVGCGSGGAASPAATGDTTLSASGGRPTSAPPTEEPLPPDVPAPSIRAQPAGSGGSGPVTISDGGTVTATADDGTIYTLEVPPGALREDVTVAIHPLGGTTDIGTIIAGADFAPAGLVLALPGTLTVTLPEPQPAGLVGLSFTSDPADTAGRLLPGTGADTTGRTLVFSVPHFSGSVAVSVGANGNTLYTTWSGAREGSSPAARQAVAETRFAAATLAEREGRISKETADGIRERANDAWLEAEAERIASEGKPGDLDHLRSSIERTVAHEHDAQVNGTSNSAQAEKVTRQIINTAKAGIKAIVETIQGNDIQKAVDSGRLSSLAEIEELIVSLLALERDLQLLGMEDSDQMPMLLELNNRIVDALVKSCNDAPVPLDMILNFKRFNALMGDEGASHLDQQTLERCAGYTPGPSFDVGPFGADGTLTYNTTTEDERGTTSYAVTLKLKIREGVEAHIFGKGSTFRATYTFEPKPVYGDGGELIPYTCPTSYSWEGTMGTMSNSGGWDPGSDPSPEGSGFSTGGTDDDLLLMTGVSVDSDNWPDGCTAPSVSFGCPSTDELTGKLVGSAPSEWSFACTTPKGVQPFVSVGGRLIQVEVRDQGAGGDSGAAGGG